MIRWKILIKIERFLIIVGVQFTAKHVRFDMFWDKVSSQQWLFLCMQTNPKTVCSHKNCHCRELTLSNVRICSLPVANYQATWSCLTFSERKLEVLLLEKLNFLHSILCRNYILLNIKYYIILITLIILNTVYSVLCQLPTHTRYTLFALLRAYSRPLLGATIAPKPEFLKK